MVWFKDSIINGLQMLMALRLRNTPSAETMQAVAKVWMAALSSRPITWTQELDEERIKKAFTEIAATSTHWPTPAEFLAVMPPRKEMLKLAAPVKNDMSPKTREMVTNLLNRMRKNVTQ